MTAIRKYPRTPHLAGSRLQPGDEDLRVAGFDVLRGRNLVVEEKVDGANAAISFDAEGALKLQSRGHYLTGGGRERHFDLFKRFAHGLRDRFWPALGDRYIVYGEWVYAKHTIFYDALPHYFLEFDVLDRASGDFLSTPARGRLLEGLLCPVAVIHQGPIGSSAALAGLVGHSAYKSSGWRAALALAARVPPHDPAMVERQTDRSDLMEGLYIKVEEDGRVVERFKYVRQDFLTTVADSESHWQSRPILPNRLRADAAVVPDQP